MLASARHTDGDGWAVRQASRLVGEARGAPAPFARAADAALFAGLERVWVQGWQPVDLWQVSRRRQHEAAQEFLVDALAAEATRYAEAAMHPRWRAQLAELGASVWWDPALPFIAAWSTREAADDVAALAVVLEQLAHLGVLPAQPVLLPPPGTAAAAAEPVPPGPAGTPRGGAADVDPKMLARVRALLAKAESTPYPEEADAFFAKAQDLMSRYSLERAVREAAPGAGPPGVRTGGRRIWLDNPYLRAKSMLVGAVATPNHCQAVFTESLGFVTVIGEDTDTELVEVLSTSLLVQAGRAMLAAGRQVGRRGQPRTKSFRRAFLMSYAQRIGERLAEASRGAEAAVAESVGDDRLLPVLAAKDRAVERRVAELYPDLVTRRSTVSNSAGWHAGRAAADLAVLDARRSVRGR